MKSKYPLQGVITTRSLFRFAKKQIIYLNKYKEFSKNKGAFDTEQANLRENCLKYWEIPDKPRNKDFSAEPAQLALRSMFGKHVSLTVS
jgi:hypothetical protein